MSDPSHRFAGRRPGEAPAGGDRAVVPMVGKALEAAIVVLFIGVMTTALYGGVVPDYRTAAAAEVDDRVLVAAANGVEGGVPPGAHRAHAETTVALPTAIRDANYRILADDGAVRLRHPHPAVEGSVPLSLPDRVDRVEGTWRSGARTVVVAEPEESGDGEAVLVVRLVNR